MEKKLTFNQFLSCSWQIIHLKNVDVYTFEEGGQLLTALSSLYKMRTQVHTL